MNESILTTIKKLLGITEDYTHFDEDILIHINSVFSILAQLGVGPEDGFSIKDKSTVWDDYLDSDLLLSDVKTYIYMKVKVVFDPPLSSVVMESMNRTIAELEWRINVAAEKKLGEENQNG